MRTIYIKTKTKIKGSYYHIAKPIDRWNFFMVGNWIVSREQVEKIQKTPFIDNQKDKSE